MSRDDLTHWIQTHLFDHVPVRISVIDRDFHIVEANRAFEEAYGEWRGRLCHEVYKGRPTRCERCGAASAFADGEIRVREEQGVSPDGDPNYYVVHIAPLVRADGSIPYIIEMSTDVTATKLLEKQKLEAERLAAVGQTVAGLAHGIKNLIMGLEGGMYVARSGILKGDKERIGRGWSMLEENIERISTFAKEFLSFARGRTPSVRLVDPNEIARKVVDLFRDTASLAGIELTARLEDGPAEAPLDPEGIHTCLANLVSNALDACEMSHKDEKHVTVSTGERDGVLFFEVADDGMGMDVEIKKKVFSNFFSTKGSGKGTGLGLLTTRKIVQEHGGSVSFESTEGVGSVFRIELPRDRLPKPAEPTDAAPSEPDA